MAHLWFTTAGESHGVGLTVILEGVPHGLLLDLEAVHGDLALRQAGYGRSARQRIESDRVEVLGGLRRGRTIGSPLVLFVRNKDHSIDRLPEPVRPRPGHADLAGCFRLRSHDIRGVIERASARETAARVAAGAVAGQMLRQLGVEVLGHVVALGGVRVTPRVLPPLRNAAALVDARASRDRSPVHVLVPTVGRQMVQRIRTIGRRGDTLGGVVEVVAAGVPPGLGSCLRWQDRLDSRLAAALMSIPAIKGVEVGLGFGAAALPGSRVHDAILPRAAGETAFGGVRRPTNRAGGLEGGISNGMPVVVRAAMKPIATLRRPLPSVDLVSKARVDAAYERSDVCAVPAAAIIAEAMVRLVLADALLERVGGTTWDEVAGGVARHVEACRRL
jgi:chorismate synthase